MMSESFWKRSTLELLSITLPQADEVQVTLRIDPESVLPAP